MIEVHDLTVTYDGRDVLQHVTLTVPDGAHIALMGPSGCGKTTLLRVLAGLRAPDGGRPCRRRAHGSSGWSSARRRSSIPRRSPAVCSSAWPLRARSRMTRRYCCSTSRFALWMRRCVRV